MDWTQFVSLGAGGLAIGGVCLVLTIVQKAQADEYAKSREERVKWLDMIMADKAQSQKLIGEAVSDLKSVANILERVINAKGNQ